MVPLKLIIGGDDPLALTWPVRNPGFGIEEVEHLRCAALYGFGEQDFDRMEIENRDLFEARKQRFSWDLLEKYPEDVRILRGRTMCCREGCRRNTEAVLEVFGQDFAGRGGFTIHMGKGIDPAEVAL